MRIYLFRDEIDSDVFASRRMRLEQTSRPSRRSQSGFFWKRSKPWSSQSLGTSATSGKCSITWRQTGITSSKLSWLSRNRIGKTVNHCWSA